MSKNQRVIIYIFASFTLFFGFLLDENSSGGAKIDHDFLIIFIKNFSIDFNYGLDIFAKNAASLIHSPVFYILIGFLLKFSQSIFFIKILYILSSCLIPYIFYLIIKKKFKTNTDYIFIFSLIIFLSPYFRSSAIWLLGDNLALLLFSLSILFFIKISDDKKKVSNYYICFIFLILCTYIRYYYCIFSLYFLFIFYRNLKHRIFFEIFLLGFFLSLPAIFYFYHVSINYDFLIKFSNYSQINYYSNFLVILSIILFYLLPFSFSKKSDFLYYCRKNYKIIFLFFLLFFVIYFIDKFFFYNLIDFSLKGGGVFMKLSKLFNLETSFFLTITSLISLIYIDYLFKEQRLENYVLLIVLVASFPIYTIYQKYFDPLFYLFFFGLVKSTYLKNMLLNKTIPLYLIYGYFLSFLLFSIFYYSYGV